MSPLRSNVLAAKQTLADGYRLHQQRHREGSLGAAICASIADLRDGAIIALAEAALDDLNACGPGKLSEQVALVAHGGTGRRDVAPFSDVDLLILHGPAVAGRVPNFAQRLLRDVFDSGLTLGHSVGTPVQVCSGAAWDPEVCTSLMESRLVWGSQEMFADFLRQFWRSVHRRRGALLSAIDRARHQERLRFGETVYLLEPNIKRSRGTLRDIQYVRWLGGARHGTTDPAELRALGSLSEDDYQALARAREFLLSLRNELHFHANKAADVLNRAEQVRIADLRGYREMGGMLPVEQFMRDYFRQTDRVSDVGTRFAAHARSHRRLRWLATLLLGHRVQDDLRVGPAGIMATRRGCARMRGNLPGIMRLLDLSNLYDKPIDPVTWDAVRTVSAQLAGDPSPEAIQRFLAVLACPARLPELLRQMRDAGLLEQFIPAFRHARGLLQFNQYHKYTVDEHCIRAVEFATDLLGDPGPFGRVYRWISRKRTLHLALLIHDLGKGLPEDHREVGVRLAEATAERLRLGVRETEVLKFLVHNHQLMGHLALLGDTSDERLVVDFAVAVGSPEVLAMLYVMTAADFGAVGPDVWDGWKAELVTDLYNRTMPLLADDVPALKPDEVLAQERQAVAEALRDDADPWFAGQIERLPPEYLHATRSRQVADDLRLLHGLSPGGVITRSQYLPETDAIRVTVGTFENVVPGIFHRLTGALSSKGLEILSAEINTLADGLVIDRFWVHDPDYSAASPPDRIAEIERALVSALRNPSAEPPRFRRTWNGSGPSIPSVGRRPNRVNVDNSTSQRYTVIDVLAHDRSGLLYTIAHGLFELRLSVWRAKIATHLDQVLDVFYVTDQAGEKVDDESRLDAIRRRIQEAIDRLEGP